MNRILSEISGKERVSKQELQKSILLWKVSLDLTERAFENTIKEYYDNFLKIEGHHWIETFDEYLYLIDPTKYRDYYEYYLSHMVLEDYKINEVKTFLDNANTDEIKFFVECALK